jgi:Glycosyl transferase family 2
MLHLLLGLEWVLFLGWAALTLLVLSASRRVRDLAGRLGPRPAAAAPLPALSVVVTARDEADQIEATVRHLLRQRYPGLQIVVVDDRSTDGTGAILDRLAAEPAAGGRLRVIHNRELPGGWLGKCHACRLGAGAAAGAWILFTDGDVILVEEDLLARIVSLAERERLDHVAVLPDLRPMPPLQAGLVSAFGEMFMVAARAHEMDRDLPRGGAGVGAFNLVRRSAYDRIGGHDLLRMDLADDFKLGRLLKESGARQRLFNGAGFIRCPWHRGALNVVRGLSKNFFGGFNFSILELAAVTVALALASFGPLLLAAGLFATGIFAAARSGGAATSPALLAAALLPVLLQALVIGVGYAREAWRFGYSPLLLWILHPLSVLLLLSAAWWSAILTLWQGGVRWRDTFYPLAALRRGIVPPGAGRRFHPDAGPLTR